MRVEAVQPTTWAVLTPHNGGLSVLLNLLVACWERAAVHPDSHTLTRCIIEFLDPRNSTPVPGRASPPLPHTRGPDRNSPRISPPHPLPALMLC